MSPEELAKLQQEKMEEARRQWEALSPEEKARIEAEQAPKSPKFCSHCGSPVSGGKFCSNCGKPL